MDRLRELESFVAVADAGGFTRAALRLNVTPPAITRAVASLEGRLGVVLFQRTTRLVRTTAEGARFLDHARQLLEGLVQAEREAGGAAVEPSGHLSITAPVTFGRLHVAPVLAAMLQRHPRVTATLTGVDRVVNLIEEGHDAAVRIGELADSSMVGRRLGTVRRIVVASPSYLAANGSPADLASLRGHSLIAFGALAARHWRFQQASRAVSVEVAPRLEVNDAAAAIALAEEDFGLAMVFTYQAEAALAAGRLAIVLEGLAPPAQPVHILYPPARAVAAKLRAFIEHAAPALTARLSDLARQLESARRA